MNFGSLDIVLACLVALVAVRAALHGFVAEFFSKLAVIAGLGCAVFFYRSVAPFLRRINESGEYPELVAFLILFLVVYLIVKVVQSVAGQAFEGESLTNLDRAMGFFLGIGEGLFLSFLIILAIRVQPWADFSHILDTSFFLRLFGPLLETAQGAIPPNFPGL